MRYRYNQQLFDSALKAANTECFVYGRMGGVMTARKVRVGEVTPKGTYAEIDGVKLPASQIGGELVPLDHPQASAAFQAQEERAEMFRIEEERHGISRQEARMRVMNRAGVDPDEEDLQVIRAALNMDQVTQYAPPPNPAKETDARFKKYEEEFGPESWELDALRNDVLSSIVERHILEWRDEDLWNDQVQIEQDMKAEVMNFVRRWQDENE